MMKMVKETLEDDWQCEWCGYPIYKGDECISVNDFEFITCSRACGREIWANTQGGAIPPTAWKQEPIQF
jgi:hypothetical protein